MNEKLKSFVSKYSDIITVDMLIDLCELEGVQPSRLMNEFVCSNTKKSKTFNNSRKRQEITTRCFDNPDYLSCIEVAERYGVKKKTVWEWVRLKKLHAIKIGRQYFVRPQDIESFENSRRTIIDNQGA